MLNTLEKSAERLARVKMPVNLSCESVLKRAVEASFMSSLLSAKTTTKSPKTKMIMLKGAFLRVVEAFLGALRHKMTSKKSAKTRQFRLKGSLNSREMKKLATKNASKAR